MKNSMIGELVGQQCAQHFYSLLASPLREWESLATGETISRQVGPGAQENRVNVYVFVRAIVGRKGSGAVRRSYISRSPHSNFEPSPIRS